MHIIEIQQQIEELSEWLEKNAEPLAKSEAEFKQADDFKKTQLAICETRIARLYNTQKEIEREALASQEYQDFLLELAKKRADYLSRQAVYDAKQSRLEAMRSLNKNLS